MLPAVNLIPATPSIAIALDANRKKIVHVAGRIQARPDRQCDEFCATAAASPMSAHALSIVRAESK
ncbi:hypothetical protein [Burkholderia metallica]|uniref:hypothetical protein n=1 Tax=Burkholderia metallica TaxID=488729 RepID=UPI001575B7E6|nr:hypothetical protein [Burkholderia metallica]